MRSRLLVLAVAASGCSAPSPSAVGHGVPSEPPAATVTPSASSSALNTLAAGAACATRNPYKNLYWGDIHVHTSYSLDSYSVGNRNDPKDAYAFARGTGQVTIAGGSGGTTKVTIDRPLDFAAVTDHSEWLSITGECQIDGAGGRAYCDAYRDQGSAAQTALVAAAALPLATPGTSSLPMCTGDNAATCAASARSAWVKLQAAAAAANEPCKFTSLVGYEWTSTTLGKNLHRNVLFASDKVPQDVFDSLAYPQALDLWKALDAACKPGEGCDAITIPHNSNYSRGSMWDSASDPSAQPSMTRYQSLVEIFQHKGSSECVADSFLGDPSCSFEDSVNGGTERAGGFVRDGLARGLEMRAAGGQNPLMLGFVGSTDTHNGSPGAVAEESWEGHGASVEDSPDKRLGGAFNPGGITGVWATENTRAAIFDAMRRRETYGTSGPRMAVRMYALSSAASGAAAQAYCADPSFPKNLVDAGAKAMGSVVSAALVPTLFVSAMRDDAPLDAIEIVKLSVGPLGRARTTIKTFSMTALQSGKACVSWQDPEFVPNEPAVYYARVFQKPTWRWSHYDCARAGANAPAGCGAGGDLDVKVRERAWTSPIFVD